MTDYRLVVLGLGGLGSAAAYWASRRLGSEVLALEQYPLGHGNGGSEDHSRIIRLSYHTPEYVKLAMAALRTWNELEADSGQQLLLRTGGLDLAPAGAVIGLDAYRSSMTQAAVPFEEMNAEDVMRVWPQWRLEEDVMALFQPDAGIVMASKANNAHRAMARWHGARLESDVEVSGIEERGGEVNITTDVGRFTSEKLIICAGAWTNRALSNLDVQLPLEVTLEQVVYLAPENADRFRPDVFPIWIWMTVPALYGFPVFGEPAVKVSWDRCEIVTDVETRSHAPRDEVTETVRAFAAEHLPEADTGVHSAKTCLYTLTPDRDFIIDTVPGTSNVITAVGAGHAFKFASLIGKILTQLALDGGSEYDLSPFRADRRALTIADPIREYLI